MHMHTLLSNVRGWQFTSANTAARRRSLVTFLGTLLAISLQMVMPVQAQRFGFGTEPSEPSVLDRMKWVHPHLVANDLLDVGYFPEVNEPALAYVAVGREGVILQSPDASCWTYNHLFSDLFNVTAGDMTDPDGNSYKYYAGSTQATLAMWHVQTRGWDSRFIRSAPRVNNAEVDFLGVSYGSGRLVVVTSGGYAGTTANAADWQWSRALPPGVDGDLVSLAFRGGQWVAASQTNLIVYSRDGTNWFPSRIETPLKRIRAAAGGFVGVSVDERIGTSADGRFWSFVEKHNQGKANDISGFGGELVLVGDDSLLSSSATLKDWKKIGSSALVTNLNFNAVTRNPAAGFPFVAVGDRGTILHYTSGASKAASANNDILFDLYSVAYGEGSYAAVGLRGTIWSKNTGTNGALYTYLQDANAWTPRGSGITNDLTSVAFGKKRFVAVGGNSGVDKGIAHATILSSADTISWTPTLRQSAIVDSVSGKKAYPKTVVFGGGRFVVLAQGEAGAALVSLDGNRWETQFNPILDGMRSIGYGNGLFIAVGDRIATSPDGFAWTLEEGIQGANLNAATGGNGIWVAVGSNPTLLLVKTNSGPWIDKSDAIQTSALNNVIFAANHFVTVGNAASIYSSVDGLNWDERSSFGIAFIGSAQFAQRGIVYGNDEYAMVGDRGDISVSPKVDPVSGLPAPVQNLSSFGGSDQDSLNSISFTTASSGQYYSVGAFRRAARFGSQVLGSTTDPSPLPSLYLARHSDTGMVTFAAAGPVNSVGTHVSYLNGSVIAGGMTFESPVPAKTAITSTGIGFVSLMEPFVEYLYENCFQKKTLSRTDSLGAVGNWSRNFDGTLTDLKQLVDPNVPFFPQVRFAGVFQTSLDMGESITIESTNTPRSFFLTKVDSFSGTNTWVRWFEPTNMVPNEPLYGLKLATDAAGSTFALGAITGGLNIFSNVPPADTTTGGGGAAGARSGRPALADACPGGHSAASSALEGNPCEEACPPGHTPTLSTLFGSPCTDDGGGGGGGTDDGATWRLAGKVDRPSGLSMFLSVFDVNGKFIWAGSIGPIGAVPLGVETDASGNLYVAANLNDGSAWLGAYAPLGSTGVSNLWSRKWSFGGGSQLTALHVRPEGLAMLAGTFQRSITVTEESTFGTTNLFSGGTAAFFLRVNPDGKLRSAHAVGTASEQSGFSVVNAIHSLSPTRVTLGGYFVQTAKFGSFDGDSRGLGDGYFTTLDFLDPPKPPPVVPSPLVITRTATGIRLEWSTDSVLQRTTGLTPPNWVDVDATSPLDLGVGGSVQCYRLRSK